MKPRLYLETTIPSYLTAWPSRDLITAAHQQITKDWWRIRRDAFDVFASQFVLDEAAFGDQVAAQLRMAVLQSFPLLELSDEVAMVTSALLKSGIIPVKAAGDASHIAICAVHSIDYLMTWNCRHIANATIIKTVRKVCEEYGFTCPIICTPEELLEESS